MKKITYRKLQALGACKYHVDIFRSTWPEGVEPSLAAFQAAAELQLDLTWFMQVLLRESTQLVAFEEAIALAGKACDGAIALAGKAYDEAIALAGKAYAEATAPARKAHAEAVAYKAYAEATAAADKAYVEARAAARKAHRETLATIAWEFYKEYCK